MKRANLFNLSVGLGVIIFQYSLLNIPSKAQTPTEQDCAGAITLCQLKYQYPYALSGEGNFTNEINPDSSCLLTGEKNSVWFKFTLDGPSSSETKFAFTIKPNNSSDNYDWAVYDLTNGTCSDIKNKSALELSCNSSTLPGETGANHCGMACCYNTNSNEEWRIRYLQRGGTYAVVVNHISGPNSGFTLDADTVCFIDWIHNLGWIVTDTTTPYLQSLEAPACGATSLTFSFTDDMNCSTIENADFQLTGPGGTYTLSNVSNTCSIGVEDTFTIDVSPAISTDGAYTFKLVGSAGGVDDLCGNPAPADSFQFTLSGCGCTASITPSGPYCLNAPDDTLEANYTGDWTGNGIINASLGIFNPSTAGVGTHTITFIASGTCDDTTTTDIVVTNATDATITLISPVCESAAAFTLTAASGGGTWSGTGVTDSTFTPSIAGAGTHTITYTISGSCGNSATEDIIVNPDKDATITSTGPYCVFASPFDLTAAEAGGTWSGTGITNSANGTFAPINAGMGTHSITYTIPGTCGSSDTKDIVVDSILDATITEAGPFCSNSSPVTLIAGAPSGEWSGTGITNATDGSFAPSEAGEGTHEIIYAISGYCGDIDSVSIIIVAPPTVTTAATGVKCSGDCNGQIVATVTGTSTYSYLWNDNNGQTNATATGLCAGNYSVTVTDINNSSCIVTGTETVQDNNTILADFTIAPLTATTSDPQVSFIDNSLGNISIWNWTFYDIDEVTILRTSNAQDTTYQYPEQVGVYPVLLEVTDNMGCKDTTTKYVKIDGKYAIYIPNAFTPNGDDVNDKSELTGKNSVFTRIRA